MKKLFILIAFLFPIFLSAQIGSGSPRAIVKELCRTDGTKVYVEYAGPVTNCYDLSNNRIPCPGTLIDCKVADVEDPDGDTKLQSVEGAKDSINLIVDNKRILSVYDSEIDLKGNVQRNTRVMELQPIAALPTGPIANNTLWLNNANSHLYIGNTDIQDQAIPMETAVRDAATSEDTKVVSEKAIRTELDKYLLLPVSETPGLYLTVNATGDGFVYINAPSSIGYYDPNEDYVLNNGVLHNGELYSAKVPNGPGTTVRVPPSNQWNKIGSKSFVESSELIVKWRTFKTFTANSLTWHTDGNIYQNIKGSNSNNENPTTVTTSWECKTCVVVTPELTQPQVESTTGLDYTTFGSVSTERLDQWVRTRSVRRVFNSGADFDFNALGYPDKMGVFVRNTDPNNGINIIYGVGGAITRNVTVSNGIEQVVAGQDLFNLQPNEMAFFEKEGDQLYVSIIPGKRVNYFENYAQANTENAIAYDAIVVIRDKGEVWGRKTNTNVAMFPANGVPNDDWFKIISQDPQTLILNYIEVTLRSAGTNAGSRVDLTFVDVDGNNYPNGDWAYSANLVQYAGGTNTIITDKALYGGSIVLGRNKQGSVKFYYTGEFPNGLSAIQATGSNGGTAQGVNITYSGTNYNDVFVNTGSITDPIYWTTSIKTEATDQAEYIQELTEYTAGEVVSFREPDNTDADYGTVFNWIVKDGQTITDTELNDNSNETELIALKPKLDRFGVGTVEIDGLVPDWKPNTEYTTGDRVVAPMPINADFISSNGAIVNVNYIFEAATDRPNNIATFDETETDGGDWNLVGVYRINGLDDRVLPGTGLMAFDPTSSLSNSAKNEFIHWTTTDNPQGVISVFNPAFITVWKDYTGENIVQPTAINDQFEIPANSQMWVHRVGNAIQITFESNEGGGSSTKIFDSIGDVDGETFVDGELIMTREAEGAVSWIFELNATEGDYETDNGYFNKLKDQHQAIVLEADGGDDNVASFSQLDANFGDFLNDLDPAAKFYYVKRNAASTATQSFESGVTTVIPSDDFEWYLFRRINISTVEFMGKPFSGNATHTVLPVAIAGNYDLDILQQNSDYYQAVGGGATVIGTVPYTGFDPTNDLLQIEYQGNASFGFQTLVVANATRLEKYARSRYSDDWKDWRSLTSVPLTDGYIYSGIDIANSSFGGGAINFNSSSFNTIYDPKGLVDDGGSTITIDSPEKSGAYMMSLNVTSGTGGGAVVARVNGVNRLTARGEDGADSDAAVGVIELNEGDVVTISIVSGNTTYGVSFTMSQVSRFIDETQFVSSDQILPVQDNTRIIVTGFGPTGGTATTDITTFTVPEDGDYEYETNVEGFHSSVLAWNKTLQVRDAAGGGGNLIMSQALTMGASATTGIRKMAGPEYGTVTLQGGVTYTMRLVHANEFTDQLSPVTLILRRIPNTVEALDINLISANTTEVGTPKNAGSTREYVLQWNGTEIVNTLAYEKWISGTVNYTINHLTREMVVQGYQNITSSGSVNWIEAFDDEHYTFAHDINEAQSERGVLEIVTRSTTGITYVLYDNTGTGDAGSVVHFTITGRIN